MPRRRHCPDVRSVRQSGRQPQRSVRTLQVPGEVRWSRGGGGSPTWTCPGEPATWGSVRVTTRRRTERRPAATGGGRSRSSAVSATTPISRSGRPWLGAPVVSAVIRRRVGAGGPRPLRSRITFPRRRRDARHDALVMSAVQSDVHIPHRCRLRSGGSDSDARRPSCCEVTHGQG
jgi:hypothetical protein